MKLTSPAFFNNQPIPKKYACEGGNVNPALAITHVPEGTKSLVLIIDDIDAPGGSFIHWLAFDIPPAIGMIGEGAVPGRQCVNSARQENYYGPCPPSGTHRYIFRLYALDTMIGLPDGARMSAVKMAMQGHIIEETDLTGLYKHKTAAAVR